MTDKSNERLSGIQELWQSNVCRHINHRTRKYQKVFKSIESFQRRYARDRSAPVLELDQTGDNLVHAAISQLIWTRAYYRTLKLARTIANLDGSDQVLTVRMTEALRYRPKEMRGAD